MKKLLLFTLLSFSSFCGYSQSNNKATNDTIATTAPLEQWEYQTIYVYNTNRNAYRGEVEFKALKDPETLNKYGREGWELIAVTPVIGDLLGKFTYTPILVYTFKRRVQTKK